MAVAMLFLGMCVSDDSTGFVGQVSIYLFIYFAITDFTFSLLYFQFQFLNEYYSKMCMIANELGHSTTRRYTT